MKIELKPVIELDLSYLDNENKIPLPEGDQYGNPTNWHKYYSRLLELSDFSWSEFSVFGFPLMKIEDIIEVDDLKKLIDHHVYGSDYVEGQKFETCAFFGGILVYSDDSFIYKCQCCSMLNEIFGYKFIVDEISYNNVPFLIEGHPSPIASKKIGSRTISISCDHFNLENNERPWKSYEIDSDELGLELNRVLREIEIFACSVDKLSDLYDLGKLSDQLIYDSEEYGLLKTYVEK